MLGNAAVYGKPSATTVFPADLASDTAAIRDATTRLLRRQVFLWRLFEKLILVRRAQDWANRIGNIVL